MKKLLLSAILIGITIILVRRISMDNWPLHFFAKENIPKKIYERKAGADKQMASWWWTRAYPDPVNINDKFYDAWLYTQAIKLPRLANGGNNTSVFSGSWKSIGPNQNIGGRILCIAVDPLNSNNIFIGSASGGIWKSKTGGIGSSAWKPVSTGFPVVGVASIIIDPSNPNIIYAGTGEVYRTDTSNIGFNVWKARGTYGIGILKSSNAGQTWNQIFTRSFSNMFGIQMLEFDPANSNIIYACSTDGLYRSTDAGSNWIKILDKIYVSDVVINPLNSNEIIAAVGNLLNADKGIYRTTNGGISWTKITAGLPSSFEGFIRLDNVRSNPRMIIASIGRDAGTLNELYRSTDFGATWSILNNSNHCRYQFWFAHDIAINPSNTNLLMMGGVPLYGYNISSSNRNSISKVHADIHDIEYDPSNTNIIYVASDGGMYKSTNGGSNFFMINGGLHAVQFYASFAVSPTNPDIMIGGLQDNGVVLYNGTSWTSVVGGDGGPCVFHPNNSNVVFASNDARRVLKSNNGGSSFPSEVLSSWAFVADSRTAFMAPIAISKSSPNIIYVASDNLHKSTNTGTAGSWTGNSYTNATSFVDAKHKTGIALAVSATNANKLYVSTSPFAQYDNDVNNLHVNTPPNLLKSINGGTSFTNAKGTVPDRFVMDFAISPTNDDSVWIVLGGFGTSHVYVTANGGLTWTSKGNGLPDVPHNAVVVDPKNPSSIYVGNDLGVYMSPDKGANWYDFNNALWDATIIMDLIITPNDKIVAATHGKGVFISDMYTNPLPVNLVSFTGINQGNFNHLKWMTSFEENLLQFELERSIDGSNFNSIATLQAKNSSTGSSYSYKDPLSNFNIAKTIFYRLKIIDNSGQFTYSNVVLIRLQVNSIFVVTGNPFGNELKFVFNTSQNQNIEIKLHDAAGKLVARKTFATLTGVNNFQLDNLRHVASGNYVLEAWTKEQRFTRKVVKTRN